MKTRYCLLALLLAGASAHAETLAGTPDVVDADTFKVGGESIRLEGVDAPETGQQCERTGGERYRCGKDATDALRARIAGAAVACEVSGRDRYGRALAVCRLAGVDLNGWLVSEGWALAYRQYSEAYIAEEAGAKDAKRGVWAGRFVKPWDWRRGKRLAQGAAEETGRKVNINKAGAGRIAAALNGIGPVKAKAIIEHRERNGPFKSVEELLDVKGIGRKTLERIRTDILLQEPSQ